MPVAARRPAPAIGSTPTAVAAAITPRTRAICLIDPVNPYGTAARADEVAALARLAERHGVLLIDDVTHGPLAIDPASALHPPPSPSPSRRSRRSRCRTASAWPARGSASSPGPRALMRGCLQLKAALTRLNTNPISQRGALAALRDEAYLESAQATIRANLAHLEETLRRRRRRRARRPPRARAGVRDRRLGLRGERAGGHGRPVRAADRRLPGRRPRRGGGREHGPAQPVQPRALGHGARARRAWARPSPRPRAAAGASPSRRCSTARAPAAPPGWPRGSGMEDSNAAPRRRASHDRAAHRDRRRRRGDLRGDDREAGGPGPQGLAVHRVRGHRLLAVRHPVRARRRDPALRGPVPVDRRALRRRRPRHEHGDGHHRHRPRPRRRDGAQPAHRLRQADRRHRVPVGEARRPGREPRGPALRQEHPQGDGVRQAARLHQDRRGRRGDAARGRDGGQPRPPRPRGALHRRGPVGAARGARPGRRRARPPVARRPRRDAPPRHRGRGLRRRRPRPRRADLGGRDRLRRRDRLPAQDAEHRARRRRRGWRRARPAG